MAIDWQHVAETVVTVTVPILILMWKNRNSAKQEQDIKHEQNQQELFDIKNLLEYHEPHTHTERTGPLFAEGLRFPRK